MPAKKPKSRFYRLTRDLHLYLGLFVSPFVLVFALSVLSLNHTFLPGGAAREPVKTSRMVSVQSSVGSSSLDLARQVRQQINLQGEIDYVNLRENRLSFPMTRPGWRASVDVDLTTGIAEIEQRESGAWDAMNYLHKMPGPHNVAVRGNWLFTKIWGVLADTTVYLLLFVSASGVYMWTLMKAERKGGLVLLGTGVMSFLLMVVALIA